MLFKQSDLEPTPGPQLDLPPITPSPPPISDKTSPIINPNSYAGEPDEEGQHPISDFESDRSQRFGPPYDDDPDNYYRNREREREYDRPIKYSNDDDKYYSYPHQNPYEHSERLHPYDDGFVERFRVENENLQKFLNEVDQKSSHECQINVAAQWHFENNVNEATQLDAVSSVNQEAKQIWNK